MIKQFTTRLFILRKIFILFLILTFTSRSESVFNRDVKNLEKVKTSPGEDWKKDSFFYGILSEVGNLKREEIEGDICYKEMRKLLYGLRENDLWALKAYDASGSPQSNVIFGHKFWLGSETSCDLLNHRLKISFLPGKFPALRGSAAPFEMKYSVIYANYTSNKLFEEYFSHHVPFHIGVCMPKSCTNEKIFQFSSKYFSKNILRFQKLYNLTLDVIEVKKISLQEFIDRLDVTILILIVCTFTIPIFLMNLFPVKIYSEGSVLRRIFKCFNLKANCRTLMEIDSHPNSIRSANGIKTIVCLIIVLGHVIYFASFAGENITMVGVVTYNLDFVLIFMSGLYVDAFFTTSSFILVFNFLNNEKQKNLISQNGVLSNLKLYSKLVLHRYLRLTPIFVMTIIFSHLMAVYVQNASPFYVSEKMDLYCPQNSWWRSLFYIHGYFPVDTMCGSWTWYLSAEMQYFCITLIILFILVKNENIGKIFIGLLCLISLIYSLYANFHEGVLLYTDKLLEVTNQIYINPLMRMNPVFPGIWGGMYLQKILGGIEKTTITYKTVVVFILLWIGLIFSSAFMFKYGDFSTVLTTSFSNSFGRFFFGILITATMVLSQLEYIGWMKSFLEHRIFVHLSKLTYSIYLISPILIVYFIGASGKPFYLTISETYKIGFSVIFASYVLSILVTLFYEIPYCRLSSEFLLKRSSK